MRHDPCKLHPRWHDREASALACLIAIALAWAFVVVAAAVIDTRNDFVRQDRPVIHYSGR